MNNQHEKFISNISNATPTVGNSWIICKSKSYPGRVYYFNTISGEAAWNLSVAEMEKAKKTTLESEHKIKHTDFPEPLETPHDFVCNTKINNRTVQHSSTPARIYNKQIINNKFTRPTASNPNSYTFGPYNAINPLNFNLPTFAPLMNVPTNSIILAPPINTIQTNVDNNFTPMLNNQNFINTSIPVPNNFPNSQTQFHVNSINSREIFNKNNPTPKKTDDLRQKLLNIRNKNQNATGSREDVKRPGEIGSMLFRHNQQEVNNTGPDEPQLNVISNNNDPDLSHDLIEELLQDLDVESLKKEFGISTSECWFLVADEDVFLSYRNFIVKLLESDEQCRLVIPQVVIVQIQKSTTSIYNKESLQAASLISEALESNVAIIDEDDSYDSDDHYENIFNCCLKLVNQNCAVVFISVKDMPNSDCGFQMFTIKDVKQILMNTKLREGLSITITIPNVCDEENALNNSILNNLIDCGIDDSIDKIYTGVQVPISTKNICVQTEDLLKADVATQVDLIVPDKNINTTNNQSNKNGRGWLKRRPLARSNMNNAVNMYDTEKAALKPKVQDAATNTEIESDRNVMFHILNQAMEDNLRIKSDEWISRFVQIMEEALTQILQQDSMFVLYMPPPWTIYEASVCIKKKFSYDSDVHDAATKLSDVLFEKGGAVLRGKINKNMDPDSYMKMYSYGYYLIDALQGLILNNEDLQIAGSSLTKLLIDIQNMDASTSDSFTDIESTRAVASENYTNKFLRSDQSKQPITVVTISDSSEDIKETRPEDRLNTKEAVPTKNNVLQENRTKELATKTRLPRENNEITANQIPIDSPTKRKYNLRNKTLTETNENDSNEIILKHLSAKDSFLTNFELKSNDNNTGAKTADDRDIFNTTKGHTFDTKQSEGPKVMRNFTVCPEFEQKLNKSANFTEELSDDQILDYECMEKSVASDVEDSDENEKRIHSTPFGLDEEEFLKQSQSFKHFLNEVATKVKQNLLDVYLFCENATKTLVGSSDDQEKLQIRTQALKMKEFLDNMCISLKRISDRESNGSEKGAREMLLQIGFRDKDIDDEELDHYKTFIGQCVAKGDLLQRSIKFLVEAIGET